MIDEVDRAMKSNMEFAMELADRIFGSAGDDGHDAFLKAVGTLAHVIYLGAEGRHREEIVADVPTSLDMYLRMLDATRRRRRRDGTAAVTSYRACERYLFSADERQHLNRSATPKADILPERSRVSS
jgi:hypothetical protein